MCVKTLKVLVHQKPPRRFLSVNGKTSKEKHGELCRFHSASSETVKLQRKAWQKRRGGFRCVRTLKVLTHLKKPRVFSLKFYRFIVVYGKTSKKKCAVFLGVSRPLAFKLYVSYKMALKSFGISMYPADKAWNYSHQTHEFQQQILMSSAPQGPYIPWRIISYKTYKFIKGIKTKRKRTLNIHTIVRFRP